LLSLGNSTVWVCSSTSFVILKPVHSPVYRDIAQPSIVEDVELVVARRRIFDDEAFEKAPQRGEVAIDLQPEVDVFELNAGIVERHEFVGAVREQANPILRPLQVHCVSPTHPPDMFRV
jgi:hypothetical protein